MKNYYAKGSLILGGTVAMGTGVMISAGIFVLTGPVAEFAKILFPLAFVMAAIISEFGAYSYVKITRRYPIPGYSRCYSNYTSTTKEQANHD